MSGLVNASKADVVMIATLVVNMMARRAVRNFLTVFEGYTFFPGVQRSNNLHERRG